MSRLPVPLLLAALTLLFFAPLLLHPGHVLYSDHSDFLAEHLPAKRFLVRSWHETGELPLWCPYLYAGAPFVHDIQVGMFYPPHLLLLALREESVGTALSWLLVAHVFLAGCSMFAYARWRGLERWPALLAAVGFTFAGRWMAHLLGGGHLITQGLAWLPLALLGFEVALVRRSFLAATGAGIAFALLTLGTQPQWTFYAGLFVALSTLGTALEQAGWLGGVGERSRRRTARELGRWLATGVWIIACTAGLTAIQLLPTLEAAGESSRAAGVGTEAILEGGLRVVLFLVGPALSTEPANLLWEDRGGLAFLWLVAAVLGALFGDRRVRYQAWVCLGLCLFALGGAWLVQPLPGFRLFRQPARMMIVAALPLALLAGQFFHCVLSDNGLSVARRATARRWLLRLGVAVAILCGGFALRRTLQGEPVRGHVYWASLLLTVPLFGWLLLRLGPLLPRQRNLFLAVMFVDLWALSGPFVQTRSEAEVYAPSSSIRYLREHAGLDRVLDVDGRAAGREVGSPLGPGAPLALLEQIPAVRGYSPLDTLRYREYLQFIADKDDPLRALDGVFTYPLVGNLPLVNRPLLDLLGVRYLLLPREELPPGPRWSRVLDDETPAVYDFLAGGRRELPPYALYENGQVLPRAFYHPEAQPAPPRDQALASLRTWDLTQPLFLSPMLGSDGPAFTRPKPARIVKFVPNEVVIEVECEGSGWVVSTDVWYPGWQATVNGATAPVLRANHVFRAVPVAAGANVVVFRFEPASYALGRRITFAALVLVGVALLLGCLGLRHQAA